MGLDIDVFAIAKDKVTEVVKKEYANYSNRNVDEILVIPNEVMQKNEKINVFYARKNEFLKKELQNAIRGTITSGDDYLGHLSDCIIEPAALERLQARVAVIEQDITATLICIQKDYNLSSHHAAVVSFSELVVCVNAMTRAVSAERFYLTFSWIS